MAAKDFLNFRKPHFWAAMASIAVLGFAGVVSVLDKEEPTVPVEVPTEEVTVEVEEVTKQPEEPEKTESQIILERFRSMDWEDVKKNAKAFGEEGWEQGIVVLAELPNAGITLYGYNDSEYQYRGVAVDHMIMCIILTGCILQNSIFSRKCTGMILRDSSRLR